MIRTVPTRDLGLDVLLGGGFRLVTRLPERASAMILMRGGAGVGKTLLGLHAALQLAEALGGDVAVGCVEILPSEYVAQIRSARPDLEEGRVVMLPAKAESAPGPRVFCGLLTELDLDAPDLVASLEALERDVATAGGKPAVFIVDSLIEGYGIGASAPRAGADAVMKFAAQGGYGLVLCEETHFAAASPWVFAADTVIELAVEARERGRSIEVRKHRFGASVPGQHELDLRGSSHPAVFPEPHAWVARDLRDVLRAHGWEFREEPVARPLVFHDALRPEPEPEPLEGTFVLVASADAGLARTLAFGLLPAGSPSERDLVIELDPLLLHEQAWVGMEADIVYVPTVHGSARALRRLVEQFAHVFERDPSGALVTANIRRVLLGDIGLVLAAPHGLAWTEAIRVFARLVIEAGWGIPVIAYESRKEGEAPRSLSILSTHADVRIDAPFVDANGALASERASRKSHVLTWPVALTRVSLPKDLAHLERLVRPHGRATDSR